MKKLILGGIVALGLLGLAIGITYAAFTDQSKFMGSTFSVGSADIKLLNDLAGGTDSSNLTDQKQAPSFVNITPHWSQDYLVKIYNNSTTNLNLTSSSDYTTANDPDSLRSYIFVEIFDWNDTNNNGQFDTGELGTSYGRKTIIKWKSEGFNLGQLNNGDVRGLVLRFSTDDLSDTKQGKTGIFDFTFDAVGI